MTEYLKKSEFWGAMILLSLHVILFPVVLNLVVLFFPDAFSLATMNLLYYVVSAVLSFVFLGGFLRRSFDTLLDNTFRCVTSFALGWVLYFVLAFVAGFILQALSLNDLNPNEETIGQLLEQQRNYIVVMTVFLAPIVEECIFRGGLFCGLHRKNRFLAYAVSIAVFSLYHVWQYALIDPKYLLFALQYIPASFVLCWVYERSGSIWTSILFHMSFNAFTLLIS